MDRRLLAGLGLAAVVLLLAGVVALLGSRPGGLAGCAAAPSPVRPSGGSTPQPASTSHAATDLEAFLPNQIAGVPLVKFSATAASDDASGLQAVAEFLGRSPESVVVGLAADPNRVLRLQLAVIRAEGVAPNEILRALIADDPETFAESSSVTLAGRPVSRFTSTEPPVRIYVRAAREVLFVAIDELGDKERAVEEAVCRFAETAPGG